MCVEGRVSKAQGSQVYKHGGGVFPSKPRRLGNAPLMPGRMPGMEAKAVALQVGSGYEHPH